MMNPNIRAILLAEATRYDDRDGYISDMAMSSIWRDAEGEEIPAERIKMLGDIYDAMHSTINDILDRYKITRSNFARYFGIPYRTVQDWCLGNRRCPDYVIRMACEILANNK